MRKIKLIIAVLFTSFILVGCSASNEEVLEDLGLNGMDAKDILNALATNTVDASEFSVSVNDKYLTLKTSNDEVVLDMPSDEYYLSIAPYITMTHECMFHSATGCQGELDHEQFHIYFEDDEGNIIINQMFESSDNGFIDLWLPRNIEGMMVITFNDLEVEREISTYQGDKTCETTMQLS